MRHLFVANDFPPKTGGIESYLTALCSGLDPDDVTVMAPTRAGHEEVDEELPYDVVRLDRSYLRATRAVRRAIVEEARRREVDVVHLYQALPLGRVGRPVRRALDKPVTVFAHGSEVLVPGRLPFVRRSLRKVLTSADLVPTASRFTQRAVDQITGEQARTFVVPPPVDLDRFSLEVSGAGVREALQLGGRFTVLFVSRLVKRKGAEILIRAISDVPDGVAVIVGTGPEGSTLRRLVEDLEVGDRVVFAGRVSDEQLPGYYAAADVFCMPCSDRYGGIDTEGFGIVYMEASASGLPCVAGACGGSVEAVEDEVTGIVLADPDPNRLAEALNRLRTDGSERARMGAAGRERAEAEFSPGVVAERFERRLEKLVTD